MDSGADVRHEPVRDALREPASSMRANVVLIVVAMLVLALQLVGLPLLLRTAGWPAAVALVPIMLATPIHWGLVHEGIHGQLLRSRSANERVARALAIGLAVPFEIVRFGHLMHHRYTREPYDRPDVADGPRWRTRLAYYARLAGGFYVGELLVPLVAFVPASMARALVARAVGAGGPVGAQVQRLFANHAADPARRRRTRRDWLLSVALYALAYRLYEAWWPVLAVSMYLRGLWLSIADNLPHYGVALDEPGRARDFQVPRGCGVLLMNHHLHRQHHLHPTLPWTALPTLVPAEERTARTTRPAYFRAMLSQFRGLQPDPGAH